MLRHLVRATALSLYGASALAAAPASTGCPARAIQCKADDFSLCKPNALLDFYTPGLPTTGDRNAAPADFEADRFESADRTKYVLEGKAKINRVDQQVQGDRLTYWTETTAWLAEGNVRYQDAGLLMSASKGQGTTTPNTATMTDVRYQMLSSRGNGTAAEAKLIDADHATMQKVEFTTCDPDDVRWRFTAKDMAIDQAEGIARGHDVTLRIGNTPILWLPYARFPISDERQSGFLYPSFGYNNRAGIDFTLPYYLNLAPNYDATLYPRILGQRGLLAGAEFRYLTDRHRGQLEFTYMPHDRDADRERGYFHFNNFSALASNWNFSANLNHVSDKRYFEDFGDSLSTVSTALLPSNAYFNGSGRGWTASIGGDRYQITDPSLGDQFEPYRRLPRGTFEGELGLLGGLRGGIKSEFVSFYKECAKDSRTLSGDNILCPPNGERLDLYPYLNLPLEGAAWFLRPEVGVRYTRYDVTQNAWSTVENTADRFRYRNDSPKRTTPITSVDAGLIFERDTNLFGTAYTQTLEPRLFYLYVPYRNQDDLPIFDTQPLSFDFPQLFSTNRFTGADRQMDANNLTAAVTTRLSETATGAERLSASFGQIRYFDGQRVQMPGVPKTDYAGSAYVAELDLHLSDRWRFKLADQWNPNGDHTDLSTSSLQYRFGERGVLNLGYRYRRDFLEQTDVSALIPLNERWRLIGRWNYSLRDNDTFEGLIGVEHEDCCIAWRVLARQYVRDATGKASNGLYFEIEFKGIGAIGQKTDDFLRRGILGYQ